LSNSVWINIIENPPGDVGQSNAGNADTSNGAREGGGPIEERRERERAKQGGSAAE
jgi:hypothetical protein